MDHGTWGDNLRAARQAAGLSQQRLADLAGVRQATVCNIENSRVQPSDKTKIPLARVLQIPVYELFPYD